MTNIVNMVVALSLLCTAWTACDRTDDGLPDAPPPDAVVVDARPVDASPPDAAQLVCPTSYGPATIVNNFFISASTINAFDLDGDGTPDNHLRAIDHAVDDMIGDDLENGAFRFALELQMLDDNGFMNDPEIVVAGYDLIDTDVPTAPADDFSSIEPFYFSRDSVSVPGCSAVTSAAGELADGAITGTDDALSLPFGTLGRIPLENSQFDLDIAPSGAGYRISYGRIGGILSICELSKISSPIGYSILWAVVDLQLQPDMDRDGDGVEQIVADGFGIRKCTDGDGKTEILGADCPCDPAIADGYSALVIVRGTGARLLGPVPE